MTGPCRVSIARILSVIFLLLYGSPSVLVGQETSGDTSRQIWANYIVGLPQSEKLYLEVDAEVARQVSGSSNPWGYIYGTGLAEYYPNKWIDLTGELVTGYTKQDRDENSVEATVRLGIRFHFLKQIYSSNYLKRWRPERLSGSRVSFANLARIEQRNFWYSGKLPNSQDLRFRNRIELKLALNRESLGEDGVWYLIADQEWFVPLNDNEAPERFATKTRTRLGLGYRRSYQWRFDALAMRDDTRDTLEGEIRTDALMIDLRLHWYPE